MANKTRKKGFSLLSFLLGIIFGIIFLIVGVAGLAFYALKTDVDSALDMVGLENKDANGNNVYINSDVETGGAASLLDLVSKVTALAGKGEALSVGEIEGLLPVVGGFVDQLYDMVNKYVPMERAELAEVNFAGIGEFIQEKVYDIQPAVLFGNLGMEGLVDSKLMSLVFLGREADYVQSGENKYPVYYDTFTLSGNEYTRVGDGEVLTAEYAKYVESVDGGYRLYHYMADTTCYIKDTQLEYSLYTPEYASLTGYYYMNGEERVVVTPISMRDFADGQFSMLEDVYLTDVLAEGNELAEKILGGISIGDLMSNGVDFGAILSGLTLSDVVATNINDNIMMSLIWRISEVEENAGGDYTHTGVYKVDGFDRTCYIQTELSESGNTIIKSAYYLDDNGDKAEITSLTVADLMNGLDISDLLNDFTISSFVDIKADEAVMAYLGYGLYEVKSTGAHSYEAKCDIGGVTVKAYVTTDADGIINKCYYNGDNGQQITIKSTGIDEISGLISSVTSKLTIGDFIGETDDPLLKKLGKYTINNVSDGINELTLSDIMTIKPENTLLYNLKDVTVAELPEAIENLKLSDIMTISESDSLLYSIKDSTIKELPKAISNLTINTIYAEEIYKIPERTDDNGNVTQQEVPAKIKLAATYNPQYLYYTLTDGKYELVDLGHGLGKLEAGEFRLNTYYTYGEAQGIWKMLLYTKTDGGIKTETAYTVNNLTAMIDNVADNMASAKLKDLDAAGILMFQEGQLTKTINGVEIGEMGLMDFINASLNMIDKIPSYN